MAGTSRPCSRRRERAQDCEVALLATALAGDARQPFGVGFLYRAVELSSAQGRKSRAQQFHDFRPQRVNPLAVALPYVDLLLQVGGEFLGLALGGDQRPEEALVICKNFRRLRSTKIDVIQSEVPIECSCKRSVVRG